LDISFATDRLRRNMNDGSSLLRAYGSERAKALQRRLSDLDAALVLEDMRSSAGRCEELIGNRKGQLSVRLDANYRLIFEPADDPPALKEDQGIDWSQVRAVRILEVVDYH
jgi:plasmid maintenance system killer protein